MFGVNNRLRLLRPSHLRCLLSLNEDELLLGRESDVAFTYVL
jgi:hypothetical protein